VPPFLHTRKLADMIANIAVHKGSSSNTTETIPACQALAMHRGSFLQIRTARSGLEMGSESCSNTEQSTTMTPEKSGEGTETQATSHPPSFIS